MVGTASDSGDFALWSMDESGKSLRSRIPSWKKRVQVPGHRGDPLKCIAFSRNGTLVAVSGDQRASGGVSLWDTSTCSLLGELPSAFTENALQDVPVERRDYLFFLPESPLLVLVCSSGIVVYNVLSLGIVWSSVVSGICHAAADPYSSHWAIVVVGSQNTSKGNILLLFKGGEKQPKAGWLVQGRDDFSESIPVIDPIPRGPLKHPREELKCQTHIAFIPPNTRAYDTTRNISVPGCSPIVVFTQDREFSLAVCPDITQMDKLMSSVGEIHRIDSTTSNSVHRDLDNNAYKSMFGHDAKASRVQTPDAVEAIRSTAYERNIALFDVPSHALPPVDKLCHAFLENILGS